MKKTTFVIALLSISLSGFSQFKHDGFGNLKLGMSKSDLQKMGKVTIKDDQAKIKYRGVSLKLEFYEGMGLFRIESKDPKAKLEGILSDIMGKSYKEVKSVLGKQLQPMDHQGISFPGYYMYYRKESDKESPTSCVLHFDEKGKVEYMFAAYNP